MTAVRVSPSWLALREPADATARAGEFVGELARELPTDRPLVIHDLACGTGSMLRWLAPQLPGPQRWICHDIDPDLLGIAIRHEGLRAADGSTVSVAVRQRDVTRLTPADVVGAHLITCSALLDLLTAEALERFVAACVDAHCPALITLSVTGRVQLWPPHPLDITVGAAFNDHQRRIRSDGPLLGPDAADAAAAAFSRSGWEVTERASPWRLGAAHRALIEQWFAGWLAAACEQRPELTTATQEYRRRRFAEMATGGLRVVVHHHDILARPSNRRSHFD